MRHSVAPELFRLGGSRGLAEVVAGVDSVREVVRGPEGLPGLWVIPPGADPTMADYQLQYDTARVLIAQLRRDVRYVVIEAQAADDGADTFALAEFADTALLTVEVEKVRQDEARSSARRLQRMRVPLLGAVALPAIGERYSIRPVQSPPRPAAGGRDTNGQTGRPPHGEFTGPAADRPREGHGDPADRVTRR
jgi:Mrp family chromosome partitioning ATPase